MVPVGWAARCVLPGRRVVGMRSRGAWGVCWGSARESSGAAHIWRRDWLSFPPGSANGRVPSGWRSWGGRGCPIALACSTLSLVP